MKEECISPKATLLKASWTSLGFVLNRLSSRLMANIIVRSRVSLWEAPWLLFWPACTWKCTRANFDTIYRASNHLFGSGISTTYYYSGRVAYRSLTSFSVSLTRSKILSIYKLNGNLQTPISLVMVPCHSLISSSKGLYLASPSPSTESLQLQSSILIITQHIHSPLRKVFLLVSFLEHSNFAAPTLYLLKLSTYGHPFYNLNTQLSSLTRHYPLLNVGSIAQHLESIASQNIILLCLTIPNLNICDQFLGSLVLVLPSHHATPWAISFHTLDL